MKFDRSHEARLADEFNSRYVERKFPDEVLDMLSEIPHDKLGIIIDDNGDPSEGGPILESIIHAVNRPSFSSSSVLRKLLMGVRSVNIFARTNSDIPFPLPEFMHFRRC